jgi:Outer membrane protein beta-barrel domain
MIKKILLFLCVAGYLQIGSSQVLISLLLGDKLNSGKIEFGLDGGFNASWISGLPDAKAYNNINLGFYFNFKMKNNWYFNTGVLVKSTVGGSKLSAAEILLFDPTLTKPDSGKYSQHLNYFHVPLLIQYRIKDRWVLDAGLRLGLLYKGFLKFEGKDGATSILTKTKNRELFNRIEAGVGGGFGYILQSGLGMKITLKYFYGLTNILKGGTFGLKNHALYAQVNIPIGRGKAMEKENGK